MTREEAEKAFEMLKEQGQTDEEILGGLYVMFQQGKISLEELESYLDTLGYELTEEFKEMSPEDQKTKGIQYDDEMDDIMTEERFLETFEKLKQQGCSEEDIIGGLYVMYQQDKISLEEMASYLDVIGYELTEEFKAMSLEDKKTKGISFVDEEV